jgi:DNA-binding response OmpR family regulator
MPHFFSVEVDLRKFPAPRRLERSGYTLPSRRAADARLTIGRRNPSLVLIDITTAITQGLELCRQIRQDRLLARTPVMFLGDRAQDCAIALESGDDDCVTMPIGGDELLARVEAILRRAARSPRESSLTQDTTIKIGDIEIDGSSMKVFMRGKDVEATTLEFRLTGFLARNGGRVFTRDQLLGAVWDDARFVTPRSVEACVRRVRNKIEANRACPSYPKTIRGVGYRFEANRPCSE